MLYITPSKAEVEKQIGELQRETLKIGLKINADKIQAMVINRNNEQPISVNCEEIRVVEQFKCQGSIITEDGDSFHEMKSKSPLLEIIEDK